MDIYNSRGNKINPNSIDLNIKDTTDSYENIKLRMDNMIEDITTIETDEGTIVKFFDALGNLKREILVQGKQVGESSIIISDTAPTEDLESVIWADTTDGDSDNELAEGSVVLDSFRNTLELMNEKVNKFDYAMTHSLDLGYFGAAGEDVEVIDPDDPDTVSTMSLRTSSFSEPSTYTARIVVTNLFNSSGFGKGDKNNICCSNVFSLEANTTYQLDLNAYVPTHKTAIETNDDGTWKDITEEITTSTFEFTTTKSYTSCRFYTEDVSAYTKHLYRDWKFGAKAEDLPSWLTGDVTEENPDYKYTFLGSDEETFIHHIQMRRGYKADLAVLDPPLFEGEFAFCIDTNELYIGNRGIPKLVGGNESSASGGGNLTGKYLELESDNNEKYRVIVDDDGNLHVDNILADTSIPPSTTEASIYSGLIIRHVYGGGVKDCGGTVCSHSFIELYNNSTFQKNLNGLSVQYAELGGTWKVKPLRGIIPPYHSFLIRCAQHSDMNLTSVRYKIKDFDMSWPSCAISDRGFKIYLGIGVDPIENSNPYNINGAGMLQPGYIDLFGVGGITETDNGVISDDFPIDASEFAFVYCVNKNRSAERRCNISSKAKANEFADTDKNSVDIRSINLKSAPVEIFRPRCLKDGRLDSYYDKISLQDYPMCINMGYGKDGNTTRTFAWQTLTTHKGYIKYKSINGTSWMTKRSTIKHIGHPDCDATVHNVILYNLEPGKYVYKVGSESCWSDEYEFEVKVPTNSDTIKILWTSDQQGWNEHEYKSWGIMYDAIKQYINNEHDFMINTGDISQNGGGHAYEWRYYYDFAPDIPCKCHMTTCGNNDLTYTPETDKKDNPEAFTWYTCIDQPAYISCYSWDYGYCHFICLNSNTMSANSSIASEQVAWLKQDLARPEVQAKRWRIVYMHEPVYAHTRSKLLDCFITPMANGNVDLCIGGHHHRYTRCKRMGALGPNKENNQSPTGFYSLMINACGYKLDGKTAPASNNSEYMDIYDDAKVPNFGRFEITYDKITFKAYKIYDVVPFTLTPYGDNSDTKVPRIEQFDSLIITK